MSTKNVLILDSRQIADKIKRIAYQILEDNINEKEIVIAGLLNNGFLIAQRLKNVLKDIAPFEVLLVKLKIEKSNSSLQAQSDIPVDNCANKSVIIVDDVLNSGRALAYGFGFFLNIPLKRVRTAVLVNRDHRSFPISVDFSGLEISTILQEHITVSLNDAEPSKDIAYIN